LQITPFFKNKHFELCCFVMYKVRNIVNRRESDVICHIDRRSRVPTSNSIIRLLVQLCIKLANGFVHYIQRMGKKNNFFLNVFF